ncbi:MAG: TylF/MycF/NovP-related O-methyltransferase [Thermodesulfobacteriota bacterium]
MDIKAYARKIYTRLPVPLRAAALWASRPQNLRPVLGPLTYNQDGLATRHNADFMKDPDFARAYGAGWETGSWDGPLHWRLHVILWAAARAAAIPGDFVECGVNKGGFSRAVIEYLDFGGMARTFWLLDTFQGLAGSQLSECERARGITAGGYEECWDAVIRTFAPFPNVTLVRGMVPDTLARVTAPNVAYLSVDMNCAEPEIAALEFFWPRLSSGAVVVLDDYGWKKHIEQKQAHDAFARKKGVPLLSLPTGQGLIIKP